MKTHSVYPSKVDLWLAALLIGVPFSSVGLGVYLMVVAGAAGFVGVFTGLLMGGVISWLAVPCRYTLTDESVIIECGRLREEIHFARICDVALSSNPLSAPALSLKRVKLVLDRGYRLISPRDREAFMAELKRRLARDTA